MANSNAGNRPQLRLLLLAGLCLLIGACAHKGPPAPPPNPGQVITSRSHSFYYFDLKYTVGRLGDRLRVVGTISNTIPTDLNQLTVDLTIKDPEGKKLVRVSSPFFDVENMETATFSLDLPLLHGPCVFSFRCDYIHYDDMSERPRRGGNAQASDWNYFDDKIDLP